MADQIALGAQGAPTTSAARWAAQAWRRSPMLAAMVGFTLITLLASAIGMLVDSRTVLGASTWAKTFKFSASVAVYGATLLLILPYVEVRPRLARWFGRLTGGLLIFEIVLILIQGARARVMHFNVATPLDAALWSTMTAGIMVLYAVTLIGLALLLRQRLAAQPLGWGIRLGMLIMVVGLTQGFLMPTPTASQMELLEAGRAVELIGAHTVGAPDGGPGLPVLGWSTTHGDLRIGHFVGLHGLQVIPLLALLLQRARAPWLTQRHRVALVVVGAASYLGLVALVTWQALRAQPLLAPDALTLAALLALIVATALAAAAVAAHARLTAARAR